jgi:hypothetical protein
MQGPGPQQWQPPTQGSFGFPGVGPTMPTVNGWMGQPPPNGGNPQGPMSPGAANSPGANAHKFMGAMNELRAGPSDDQRRRAEEQRTQLQRDLEEQIRQKRERKAQEKAAEEQARQKVGFDLVFLLWIVARLGPLP